MRVPGKTSDLWWLFSRQTVNVTPNASVLNAGLLMLERNFRHLPVIAEGGRIIGIISAQDVVDSLNLAIVGDSTARQIIEALQIPVQRVMSLHPVVVEKGDGLLMVTKKIINYNIGALPIINEQGVIQGIITLRDVVGLIGVSSEPLNVKVSEIMNTNVTSVNPTTPLSQAIQLLSKRRVRRLPIISEGQVRGMFTSKDILRHLARLVSSAKPDEKFDRLISEFMTREVITISKEDDIRVAAFRMMIFGMGGLVVDDLPSGIALITERDLIKKLSQERSIEFVMKAMQFELEVEAATY